MQPYLNQSGNSGVVAYEVRSSAIVVQFQDGWKYEYTAQSAGHNSIAKMKQLAAAGQGLSTYISQHVHDNYARKFR